MLGCGGGGAALSVAVTVTPATVAVGGAALAAVTVTQGGVPAAGQAVAWSVVPAGAVTFSSTAGVTDAFGIATTTVTGVTAGAATITASVGSSSGAAALTITGGGGGGTVVTLSLAPASIIVGATTTASITVTQDSAALAGAAVTVATNPAGIASVTGAPAATNASGQTTATLTGVAAGVTQVTASVGATASAPATLTVTPAGVVASRLFFLHHSVGLGVINGGVRSAVATYNASHGTSFEFWDHGYNDEGLTNASGDATGQSYDIPNDSTDPDSLLELWTGSSPEAVAARAAILGNYHVIAFKSCFDNGAHIPDVAELNQRKNDYIAMRGFFDTRTDRIFVVVTPPPHHPGDDSNATEAANTRSFSSWLAGAEFLSGHPNVVCFDLFDRLAAPVGSGADTNFLRPEYRQEGTTDSHPNDLANQTIAPEFAQALIDG
jgi:hypothetical protein